MFNKDVAPFQQKYVHLVEDIHGVYGTAKEVNMRIPACACTAASRYAHLTIDSYAAVPCKGDTDAHRRVQLPRRLQTMG